MNTAMILPIYECTETNIEYEEGGWWYAWSGPRERPTFSRRSKSFTWAFSRVYVDSRGGNADGLDEALELAKTQWFRPDAARIYEEVKAARDLLPGADDLDDGVQIHG